jgi:hypothetical protein
MSCSNYHGENSGLTLELIPELGAAESGGGCHRTQDASRIAIV